MPISKEVRLLQTKWQSQQGWPKRLEWLEIHNLRGWKGQRVTFKFPITALIGENGVGKSTIIQAIAASYKEGYYPSSFFPDTIWENIRSAYIRAGVKEGDNYPVIHMRKITDRWRGYSERRSRPVVYIDLRRIQPISARTGYARLAKRQLKEAESSLFDPSTLQRLSDVMGRKYELARLSTTTIDTKRPILVLQYDKASFSGFHQGAGETTIAELFKQPIKKYSIVLIDEIETSLHPRAQRRLIRDLASLCREQELQIVLTTHSPYILDEIPPDARMYIMDGVGGKQIIAGVSPEFAMTRMDEEQHPEADIYVEDNFSAIMLREILIGIDQNLVSRIQIIPFGAASVGRSLGIMVKQKRFPRSSVVFLDGDQELSDGCFSLPGGDAPEQVIFNDLKQKNWAYIHERVGRSPSQVIDTCSAVMITKDHHEWVRTAADKLFLGNENLWQALCAQWVQDCMNRSDGQKIADSIIESLGQRNTSSFL